MKLLSLQLNVFSVRLFGSFSAIDMVWQGMVMKQQIPWFFVSFYTIKVPLHKLHKSIFILIGTFSLKYLVYHPSMTSLPISVTSIDFLLNLNQLAITILFKQFYFKKKEESKDYKRLLFA